MGKVNNGGEQPAFAEGRPLKGEFAPLFVALFQALKQGFNAYESFLSQLPEALGSAGTSVTQRRPLV
jgi:hypothetical protein